MDYLISYGDITEQAVDAIVNSWNRNLFPWWLLLPQGVSRAIKRKAGYQPFQQLARMQVLRLGEAVVTSAGKLPHKAIIHVAGINFLWRASDYSIKTSVKNAVHVAEQNGFESIAIPLIGAGSGGFNKQSSENVICETLDQLESPVKVQVIRFK